MVSHQSPIINKWYLLLYLQSAVGWDYQAELSKHESQTDATKGFGGRYGVQKDRQDEVYTLVSENSTVVLTHSVWCCLYCVL